LPVVFVVLFLLFVILPLAELYVIIQVGRAIGVLPTLALVLIGGFVGAALARSQGRQAWVRFNETMRAGRVPGREAFDGAMIIFGGALLLSPGFITDALGIFLLLPPGRGLVRAITARAAARTPAGRPVFFVYDRFPGRGSAAARPPPEADRTGAAGPTHQRAPRRPSRAYDVEGSAREIDESEYRLADGEPEPPRQDPPDPARD
jgi:UPF0716 protein FxsA